MNRRDFLKSLAILLSSYKLISPFSKSRASSNQIAFSIPLTTLHVAENEAVVFFRLSSLSDNAALIVSKDGENIQTIALSNEQYDHQVTISDLESSTIYQVRVEVDGQEPSYFDAEEGWGEVSFHTQPFEWPIRFAAIGDSGYEDYMTPLLASYIAGHNIDFFMHLGDIVYRCNEHDGDLYQNWAYKYYLPFKDVLRQVPHYATIGNHDRDSDTILNNQSFYYWAFPPLNDTESYEGRRQWYSFTANDVQFLGLNSQIFYTDPGYREHNQWLDERLAEDGYRTKIPFFHIPFWTSSTVHQEDGRHAAEAWESRFTGWFRRIGLVINGHSHVYERLYKDNVHYITSGGGSIRVYDHGVPLEQTETVFTESHYVIVEVYPSRVAVKAYDSQNLVIDEAEWAI